MRKLVLFLFMSTLQLSTFAQSYTQLWKTVDSLYSILNYKEGAEVILKIRSKAVAENNMPEKVRTILAEHQSLRINQNDITSLKLMDNLFKTNLEHAKGIEKNLLANFYAQFLLSNIYLQRVDSTHFSGDKIENRIQKIDSLFKLSLQDKNRLKQEPLSKWATLLNSITDARLTPTIYHLLATNYLDFLKVDYTRQIESLALENDIRAVNLEYNFSDAQAYLTYRPFIQDNISYYRNNRQQYPSRTSNIDTLQKLLPTINSDFNSYIYYLIAQQSDNKTAVELLKTAKEKHPKSPWINNVDTLYEYLNRVNLTATLPSFVPSQEYTPINISQQNVNKIYIRVYDISVKSKHSNLKNIDQDSASQQIKIDAPLLYEETVVLRSFDDMNIHRSIYKINPLPFGRYQIMISNNIDFKDDGIYQETVSSNFFVSDLFINAYTDNIKGDNLQYKISLLDRKSGKPVADKKFELFEMKEDKTNLKKVKRFKTNVAGEFTFSSKENASNFREIWLYTADEKQWIALDELNNIVHLANRQEPDFTENNESIVILTDRGIYRPGQPLHFKAILHTNNFQFGKITPNQELTVVLKDANNQDVQSKTFTTNAFGSINGQFDIPAQTLNGGFRLEVLKNKGYLGSRYFRVEEYKRPTFKVEFDPNKNTYTKADTAIFTGKVESLSGAPIPNSNIKYSIQLSSYEPYKRFDKIDSTTTTDQEGKFEIKLALSDTSYARIKQLNIQINAEAKSPSEEIQRANMYFQYSDQPRIMSIISPPVHKEYKWKNIEINTSNTNGFPLPFDGFLNIYKYEDFAVPISHNGFSFQTEYHLLDSNTYEKYFPNYYDKAKFREVRNKTLIATYRFDTRDTSIVNIDSTLFPTGQYLVEGLSITNLKDTVRTNQTVNIINKTTGKSSENTFLAYRFDKGAYEENDTARLTIYSDLKNVQNVFIWRVKGAQIGQTQVVPFHGDKAVYEFIIEKNEIYPKSKLELLLLKDNKIEQQTVHIPYIQASKNTLKIVTKTFRDKITPGQKEKWSFTIKDNKSKAEVLATMYDSSIDQFASNYFPNNFQLNYPYFNSQSLSHITEEFNENAFWNSFKNYKQKTYRSYVIPRINNYGLWSNYIFPYTSLIVKKDKNGNSILEEVVVTAYGSSRKMTLTGSSVVINGQDLHEAPSANFTDLLQGKVAGLNVQVSATGRTHGVEGTVSIRGLSSINNSDENYSSTNLPLFVVDGKIQEKGFTLKGISPENIEEIRVYKGAEATALYGSKGMDGVILVKTKSGKISIDDIVAKIEKDSKNEELLNAVQARKDLKETAFFYPNLYTDERGDISFEFDSPEALTKWKLMLFAHTEDLQAGNATFFAQTQKQLMVQPNIPRFLRVGDQTIIKSLIHNLSDKALNGSAKLEIIDPITNTAIQNILASDSETKDFAIDSKNNTTVSWTVNIPADHPTVIVKVIAANEDFSDGEQQELAIIPNDILVSETQKIILNPDEKKSFEIHSQSKNNVQTQVIVQANPILEILSALDFLKHYPYDCAEQTASKWFGLKMLQYVDKHYPSISAYFTSLDTANISSSLREKASTNELSLQEMPWLRQIVNEEAKLKQLANLFNKKEIQTDLKKLEDRLGKLQIKNGAFVWFDGGKENLHISTRLLEIFGKVNRLDPQLLSKDNVNMINKLKSYLDKDDLFNAKSSYSEVVDYAYAHQYWTEDVVRNKEQKAWIIKTLKNTPLSSAKQAAGIAAKSWIVAHQYGLAKEADAVFNRLDQEYVIDSVEGRYWKSNADYYNAVSLQTYLIEAYKIMKPTALNSMADWLFYHKTHNNWQTTWMSVDAIYGLLLVNNPADFNVDNKVSIWVNANKSETKVSGIGQISLQIPKKDLSNNQTIAIENTNNRKVYGSIAHQYFLPLEQVNATHKDIAVTKYIMVFRNKEWVSSNTIQSGEKVKIRLEVVANKNLNFVHLKANRAAGFEPEFRPSGYQWWRGGYYFTNKDASTNFFIDYLSKGRHVFEYEVKTNNIGTFHTGISQIECMYDPATNARSENMKIKIQE